MRELAAVADSAQAAHPTSFDAESLAAATGGELLRASQRRIRGAAVDSRRVEPGNAFFALPGERTDGHRFVADAAARGAAALVVTEQIGSAETLPDVSVVRVADGLGALHAAAAAWREQFSPLVVGVTGSLAKTSTKEQIAALLGSRWKVLRNHANENNEIGLPLTLLRMAPDDEVAVLEMGMYQVGDIRVLANLARPSIGVVTAVRGTHLARAGSIDAIERGKRELVEALPVNGTAVLNADDERVLRMTGQLPAGATALTYGFADTAAVRADAVQSRGASGMTFRLQAAAGSADVELPALGRHGVHNALAAAAVGLVAGLDVATIAAGLARPFSVPHRSTLIDAGEWQILDDTYNASPDSMIAALDLLATLPGRHVAVLGEMLELGDESEAAHAQVAAHAARTADELLAVGAPADTYARAAREAGMPQAAIATADDRDAALEQLRRILRAGDVVLLKASRGAAFDLLVDELRQLARVGAVA